MNILSYRTICSGTPLRHYWRITLLSVTARLWPGLQLVWS